MAMVNCQTAFGSLTQSVTLQPPLVPPPPCERNTKVPKFDGNNIHCCSDKGVALAKGGGVNLPTTVGGPTAELGWHHFLLFNSEEPP